MKKKFIVVALLLVSTILMGSHLVRMSSHDISGYSKTIFYNEDTNTATDIICNVTTHVKALHDGEMEGIIFDSTIGSGDSIEIIFNSPETGEGDAHLLWMASGNKESDLFIYQTTSLTAGIEITPLNFKIGESIGGLVTTFLATDVSDTGTKLPHGGGFGAGQTGSGNLGAGEEIITNSGLTILFRLTSEAANNHAWIQLWWHVTGEGVMP